MQLLTGQILHNITIRAIPHQEIRTFNETTTTNQIHQITITRIGVIIARIAIVSIVTEIMVLINHPQGITINQSPELTIKGQE